MNNFYRTFSMPMPPEPPTDRTDLYECLGVATTATAEEIKRAYRAASLKYHPDKTRGNIEAETKFKSVNEAYKILSDPQQRHLYDLYTASLPQWGGNHRGANAPTTAASPGDIFAHFFNSMPSSAGGGGVFVGVNPHMFNASGNNKDISIHDLEECFMELMGHGPSSQGQLRTMTTAAPATTKKEPPEPTLMQLEITMQDVYNGVQLPIQIDRTISTRNRTITERETVYLEIYQGIDDGEVITVTGKGNIVDGEKGDVKVTIRVLSTTTDFKRKGLDLIFVKHISLKDALCGDFEFEIKLLDGETCTIKNKPGSIIEPNLRKTYTGMGLTRNNTKGNMIIHFIVDFPTSLNETQLTQIKGLLI